MDRPSSGRKTDHLASANSLATINEQQHQGRHPAAINKTVSIVARSRARWPFEMKTSQLCLPTVAPSSKALPEPAIKTTPPAS